MSYLAQFNIARARWDLDDPRMQGFLGSVPRINALAARTPGFVWRLEDEHGPDAPDFGDDGRMTFTLSVWKDVESLRHFTWSTIHKSFRLRTSEWFEKPSEAYLVMWPVDKDHRPTGAEALQELSALRNEGPSDRRLSTEALSPPEGVSLG